MSINAGFHKLKIAEVRRETPDAVSIRFEIPDALKDLFAFKAGQHLTLRTEMNGEDVRRNYSVCAAPHEREIRIAVKQMPGGRFSGWANSALAAGHTIEVLPPLGRFVLPEKNGNASYYVALAGGSGITPVLSIIKAGLQQDPSARFTLLYGNRDSASIMFLEELAGLKNRYLDRLEVYHFLENEAEEVELFNGRLDRAKCDEVFSGLVDTAAVDAFFICGPGPMMDAAEGVLLDRNIPKERIHIERFTADRPAGAVVRELAELQTQAEGVSVAVTLDGRTRRVPFTESNILESALAAGLRAPFACKAGVCATCRAKVTKGKVEMAVHYGLTDEEVAEGYVLTCQSVPIGDGVAVDYDA